MCPAGITRILPASGRIRGSSLQEPVGLLEPLPFPALTHPLIADLRQLACQQAADAQLSVVDVQIQSNRLPLSLLIQVRRSDGGDVNLDECARFSGAISERLDSSDLLSEPYVLEISSPGIGEELLDDRDFRSFRGFPVEVRFLDGAGAVVAREGLLLERDEQFVCLNLHGRTSRIPRADVLGVRLTTPEG